MKNSLIRKLFASALALALIVNAVSFGSFESVTPNANAAFCSGPGSFTGSAPGSGSSSIFWGHTGPATYRISSSNTSVIALTSASDPVGSYSGGPGALSITHGSASPSFSTLFGFTRVASGSATVTYEILDGTMAVLSTCTSSVSFSSNNSPTLTVSSSGSSNPLSLDNFQNQLEIPGPPAGPAPVDTFLQLLVDDGDSSASQNVALSGCNAAPFSTTDTSDTVIPDFSTITNSSTIRIHYLKAADDVGSPAGSCTLTADDNGTPASANTLMTFTVNITDPSPSATFTPTGGGTCSFSDPATMTIPQTIAAPCTVNGSIVIANAGDDTGVDVSITSYAGIIITGLPPNPVALGTYPVSLNFPVGTISSPGIITINVTESTTAPEADGDGTQTTGSGLIYIGPQGGSKSRPTGEYVTDGSQVQQTDENGPDIGGGVFINEPPIQVGSKCPPLEPEWRPMVGINFPPSAPADPFPPDPLDLGSGPGNFSPPTEGDVLKDPGFGLPGSFSDLEIPPNVGNSLR